MSSKLALNLTKYYSINFDLKKREKKKIKFIIIHYTGMKKEKDAIKRLCDYKSKVSCHYFIKGNGNMLNLVPELYTSCIYFRKCMCFDIILYSHYMSLFRNEMAILRSMMSTIHATNHKTSVGL